MSTQKAQKCRTPGCNKPHHAHGYCQHCYDNLRKRKKPPVKSAKADRQAAALPAKDGTQHPGAARQGRATAAGPAPGAPPNNSGQQPPRSARVLLIKARHEAIKREIDQIREDLESDEED